MAQITYNTGPAPKKASGNDYGIPDLSGDLNSNPGAWLKNAEAALKSFQVPQTNWVPEAAKHLKGAARAWYTNWIDANLNFDDWNLFKEDFLMVFSNNETEQDISLLLVDMRQTTTVDELSERFEKVRARMQDRTQADTVHVRSMFIKALKGYVRQYMDTEKCTSLGKTYAEALAAEKRSNNAYKSSAASRGIKKPRNYGYKSRDNKKRPNKSSKPERKKSTLLNNIDFTSDEEESGKALGSLN
jgi:hypothetical protein